MKNFGHILYINIGGTIKYIIEEDEQLVNSKDIKEKEDDKR